MQMGETLTFIIRGFIDAKNDQDRTVYGSFVALATRREVPYVSVWFTRKETPKDTQWKQLMELHAKKESDSERDPSSINSEDLLSGYLMRNSVLTTLVKNHNAKPVEQAISRYCLDQLQLRAVSFVEFDEASAETINYIESIKRAEMKKNAPDREAEKKESADASGGDEDEGSEPSPYTNMPNEIFVKCEPLLDPIGGIAMNELRKGDSVYAKLPSDSVFFKLLAKTHRSFDGVITADVTGVLVNDLGTATVSMRLSDGVNGIMKLPGKVKVKVSSGGDTRDYGPSFKFSPEFYIAAISFLILGAAIMAVIYAVF